MAMDVFCLIKEFILKQSVFAMCVHNVSKIQLVILSVHQFLKTLPYIN